MNMPKKERRNKVDFWAYVVKTLAILGWLLLAFALIISYHAAPETDYGILRYHNIEIRKYWHTPLTDYLYIVLWISALSSFLCLILHKYRRRRKNDGGLFTTILLLVITIVWVCFIFIQVYSFGIME